MAQPFYRNRQIIHSTVPVIIGAILGGLLTGIPTVWVSHSQQRLQLEMTDRIEEEQFRQRRVNAMKNYFTACANFVQATDQMVFALEMGTKITPADVLALKKDANLYMIASAELAAEFRMRSLFWVPDKLALVLAAFQASEKTPAEIKAAVQEMKPLVVQVDRGCRDTTKKLLDVIFIVKQTDMPELNFYPSPPEKK